MKTERERLEYLVDACRRRNLPEKQARFQAELDALIKREEKAVRKSSKSAKRA